MATIIEMPKLSDTMSVGTLVTWLKKEGDKVSSGDKIAEIETDKATMEMEVFEDGVLLKQIVAVGEQVAVGAPICAIGKPGETVNVPAKGATPAPAAKKEEPKPAAPAPAPTPTPAPTSVSRPAPIAAVEAPAPATGERQKISPLARKVATELGVDTTGVSGTGPGGRIVRADVEAAAKAPKPAPAPTASAPAAPAA
ncbi:MAG: E3 binding domain-containing protein, partial [Opitutaceae bacterium]|nr:E3 binding domain-containing protein [Opitutaceae bacterium]